MHNVVRKVKGNADIGSKRGTNLEYAICTICTSDYLPQATAALLQAAKYGKNNGLYILVAAHVATNKQNEYLNKHGITVLSLHDFADDPTIQKIVTKYAGDYLRWALKPSLILSLLQSYENVAYIDTDIWFVDKWNFIWSAVKGHDFLVTPHRRPYNNRYVWTDGVYQAGFVIATKSGTPTVKEWEQMCLWNCKRDFVNGLFVDQKYLDMIPAICKCKILQDKGCNVAGWNTASNPPELVNGQIFVDQDPLTFIHFSPSAEELPEILHSIRDSYNDSIETQRRALKTNNALYIKRVAICVMDGKKNASLISNKIVRAEDAEQIIATLKQDYPDQNITCIPVEVTDEHSSE